jgi:hypothetical protein
MPQPPALVAQPDWDRVQHISDEYNDLANDKVYRVFTFVEDEQIGEFTKDFNVTVYMKLDWIKATTC